MDSSWVEAVGGMASVSRLARQHGVAPSRQLLALLDAFGDMVEAVAQTRIAGAARAAAVLDELDAVHAAVAKEVAAVRERAPARCHLRLERHVETSLPVVRCGIERLPWLVAHVPRSYAVNGCLVSYGLRTREWGAVRLTGAVAAAANYLDEVCKKAQWQTSLTTVLDTWIGAASDIPLELRDAPGRRPTSPPGREKAGDPDDASGGGGVKRARPCVSTNGAAPVGGTEGGSGAADSPAEEVVACGGPQSAATAFAPPPRHASRSGRVLATRTPIERIVARGCFPLRDDEEIVASGHTGLNPQCMPKPCSGSSATLSPSFPSEIYRGLGL